MCGIAGILTNNSGHENLEILTQQIQKALQHRGSDDRGVYISPNRQAAIAHTRLAILDLSVAGHQPMSTADGRYWITFIRLAAGKQLLIQAVPELPAWVVNRPKRGFSFPFQQWMAGEWHDFLGKVDCHKNICLKSWYRRWSLALLQH